MPLGILLMSQPHWGANRTRKLLATLCVPERKTVGSLTERQRGALAAMLSPLRRAEGVVERT
jgi:hypothetical protein